MLVDLFSKVRVKVRDMVMLMPGIGLGFGLSSDDGFTQSPTL